MNKEERALEALLALAFRTELTDEEINELFSKSPQLSKEDKEMIKNWDIDKIILEHKEEPPCRTTLRGP